MWTVPDGAGRPSGLNALSRSRLRHKLSGSVPGSARQALVAVRANVEGGTPSPVNVRIADVSYHENGKRTNRVPNPRFCQGPRELGAVRQR